MTDAVQAATLSAAATLVVGILTLLGGGIAASWVAGRLTRAVKISEFRVKWIEELRSEIADFVGAAHRWIRLYEEYNSIRPTDQTLKIEFEKEKVHPVANEARVILYRIRMRINPREDSPTKNEDDKFLQALLDLLDPGKLDPKNPEASWMHAADSTVELARKILKREWEETKKPRKRTKPARDRTLTKVII